MQAVVTARVGPVSYLVKLDSGELWCRHIDHLRAGSDQPPAAPSTENSEEDSQFEIVPWSPSSSNDSTSAKYEHASGETQPMTSTVQSPKTSTSTSEITSRYPVRTRKPPDRLY